MTMDRDLFLAILAMDAYNRGYGAGIKDLPESGSLGTATIRPFEIGDKDGWEAAGFYAIAYDWGGETVTGPCPSCLMPATPAQAGVARRQGSTPSNGLSRWTPAFPGVPWRQLVSR